MDEARWPGGVGVKPARWFKLVFPGAGYVAIRTDLVEGIVEDALDRQESYAGSHYSEEVETLKDLQEFIKNEKSPGT